MAKTNKTKGKKKVLEIVGQPHSSLKVIKWSDGGQVPEILSGMWTHSTPAQQAIDAYLINKDLVTPKQVLPVKVSAAAA